MDSCLGKKLKTNKVSVREYFIHYQKSFEGLEGVEIRRETTSRSSVLHALKSRLTVLNLDFGPDLRLGDFYLDVAGCKLINLREIAVVQVCLRPERTLLAQLAVVNLRDVIIDHRKKVSSRFGRCLARVLVIRAADLLGSLDRARLH